MKFFKKVLFKLYPKLLVAQIVSHSILIFIAIKAIPVNTSFIHFYWKWKVFIILCVAILATLIFIPKSLKIVFAEPNKGQRTTRIALLFLIFLSIAAPNLIIVDMLVVSHFGKAQVINQLDDVKLFPEVSFFVLNKHKSLQEYKSGYYINNHLSGKHKKTYHIDFYASKVINSNPSIIIGKLYDTEYPGRKSDTESQRLIDKDLENANKNFKQIIITTQDTLVRTFEKFQFEKFIDAAKLINSNINKNSTVLELKTRNIAHAKQKSLIIYLGFSIFINLFMVLFLSTGMYFKD